MVFNGKGRRKVAGKERRGEKKERENGGEQ